MNQRQIQELLVQLEAIKLREDLTAEFRKEFGTDFNMVEACIKEDFIKPKAVTLIERLAPICYKINGKIFLKGEEKGEHDFIGDGLDSMTATELFNMTEEMASYNSYSFYVSTTDYFEIASAEEINIVQDFLKTL